MSRIHFGIDGFDTLFGDGVPRGTNVLLFGRAGSGKTIFGLEFIYKGALLYDEPGVYVSFEQHVDDLKEQSTRFGWNLDTLIKKNKLSFITPRITDIDRNFANIILEEAKRIGAKRIVIDTLALLSLSPAFQTDGKFSLLMGDKMLIATTPIQFYYNLMSALNTSCATIMYLNICGSQEYETKDGLTEYMCDGVINLRKRSVGKVSLRTLEILKMRKSTFKDGIHSFHISENGVVVE